MFFIYDLNLDESFFRSLDKSVLYFLFLILCMDAFNVIKSKFNNMHFELT